MHIYCKTKYAILLVGLPDEKGVLRFPNNGQSYPGLTFEPKGLMPISEQLEATLQTHLKRDTPLSLEIHHDYADAVDSEHTLYLANVAAGASDGHPDWQSLPELLRGMDKNKSRIAYLRAWQVLTGGLKLNTTAVEEAEISKYFDD